LLEYDDVANDQRKVIYHQRTEIMAADNVADAVKVFRGEVAESLVDQYVPGGVAEDQWDVNGLRVAIERDFGQSLDVAAWVKVDEGGDGSQLKQKLSGGLDAAYEAKVANAGPEVMRYIEKEIMLRMLDQHWREHLAAMDYMRQGIHLRGYAQKDPKQEYKREAFALFSAMLDRIKFDTVTMLSKIEVRSQAEIEKEEQERQRRLARALQAQHAEAISAIQAPESFPQSPGESAASSNATQAGALPVAEPFVRQVPKVGRNDACPCGSGKKYKHCHGALA
jgi:preprotein translocase subunit SecA